MADDDALYSNPRSPKREKVTERVIEREGGDDPAPKNEGHAEKDPLEGTDAEVEENASQRSGSDKDEAEAAAGDADPMKARKDVLKRHDSEREDLNGLHIKARKDMHKRHNKELAELFGMKPASAKPKKTALHGGEE